MSERMTAAEVVAELRAYAQSYDRSLGDWEMSSEACHVAGAKRDALRVAADLVERHLVPQTLDEPDGPGDYWIEGREGVRRIAWGVKNNAWLVRDDTGWELLGTARVCRVPASPFTNRD